METIGKPWRLVHGESEVEAHFQLCADDTPGATPTVVMHCTDAPVFQLLPVWYPKP